MGEKDAIKAVSIALLGRRDEPTDGIEDYCTWLQQALSERGYKMSVVRMPWAEIGWLRALHWLWKESAQWRGKWVLIQYTVLQWSVRGFPLGLVLVIWMLRQRGVLLGVVFHDIPYYYGRRLRDRIRLVVQHGVMRYVVRVAERSIVVVEPQRLGWLGQWATSPKIVFIPVGSNIPDRYAGRNESNGARRVVVFGVSGGTLRQKEVAVISKIVRQAAAVVGPLRLIVLGRGSMEAEPLLRSALDGTEVSLEVLGLVPVFQVSEVLASADVQLFIRGSVDTHRTTAVAGIVHGLALVGYATEWTGFPITDAGVRLVSLDDSNGLADALITVLRDDILRAELRKRSREATRRYFSWDAIADQFLRALYT